MMAGLPTTSVSIPLVAIEYCERVIDRINKRYLLNGPQIYRCGGYDSENVIDFDGAHMQLFNKTDCERALHIFRDDTTEYETLFEKAAGCMPIPDMHTGGSAFSMSLSNAGYSIYFLTKDECDGASDAGNLKLANTFELVIDYDTVVNIDATIAGASNAIPLQAETSPRDSTTVFTGECPAPRCRRWIDSWT
jgi:hypothetical protein